MKRSKKGIPFSHRSPGGLGLERARAKSHAKKLKKLAQSKEAYTIKVNENFKDLPRAFRGDKGINPEELCGVINDYAAKGWPLKDINKDGMIVGHLIRAYVTDAREVWARVKPLEEPVKSKELEDIW